MSAALDHVSDLAAFIEASPSSHHAAAEAARRLAAAGFLEQDESAEWSSEPGGHYVLRDGALIAWRIPDAARSFLPFRILGSHTDSTGFTLKPRPDSGGYGWQQLGIEIYGAPLLNSWLDRELGLAGRLVLNDGSTVLMRTGAIMRIPQLAIHLDRSVNDDGLKLDKQLVTICGSMTPPRRRSLDRIRSSLRRGDWTTSAACTRASSPCSAPITMPRFRWWQPSIMKSWAARRAAVPLVHCSPMS